MRIIGKGASKRVVVLTIFALLFSMFNATSLSNTAAKAADLSQFDAGNIISDSKFFDGNALSASGVQDFLNSKVPNCTINNGNPSHQAGAPWGSTSIADTCLRDYFQQTPDMAAQPGYCSAYPGSPRENAATIIAKVGQVCNISQKVLLVLLEKEQSLISDSWPTVRQINQATGFACYDNGQPCVVDYAGFFYQVWSAARQLQRYGTGSFTWYPVGQVSNIAYQANAPWCGTKSVYIQNRATAALYYYTPYTPNDAALNAGYGTGDSCSAYGNRNFYQLFVDWFGSTRGFETIGPIKAYYDSIGAASSYLGYPTYTQFCGLKLSACFQNFSGGSIYSVPGVGTFDIKSEIRPGWASQAFENGWLGYPTSRTYCGLINGGCYNSFQGGFVFWSPTSGSHALTVDYRESWGNFGFESGWLGYPTTDPICGLVNTGCYQQFQGGYIFSSPATGAHPVKPEVRTLWSQYGFESGILGYPTSDPSNTSTTYTQTFQGGTVTVTNGVARISASIDPWVNGIITNSWLGNMTSPKWCGLKDSGCFQIFQNGFLFITPATGAHPVKPEVRTLWSQYGFESGILGYPTSDP
ncbi:hypothetical protein M2118_001220, partial [Aurantimicrobium minutum]|nr:hypothetical protein [Aurantimicrobium minutum]